MIYPPEPLQSQVNLLRAKYDPQSQQICDAHICLTIPFPRPLTSAQWNELELIASEIETFSVHYGPLKNYLPHPGVCLAIEPQAKLDGLRVALEASSGFMGAPARRYPFSAHLTIAEFISVAQTRLFMDELKGVAPEGEFLCTDVSYAVPDYHFHFSERRRLGLAS